MIQIWPNLDILTLLVNEIPLVSFSTPLEGNCYVKLKGNICQKLFLYIEKYKGNFLRAPEFFSCKIIPTYHRVTHLLVNSKKFALGRCFSTDFRPKVTDQPRIFCLASIWSCTAASKLEAVKSTLLVTKRCSNQKFLADLLYQY